MKTLKLSEIARMLNQAAPAGPDRLISGVATLEEATEADVSYLALERFLGAFRQTRAGAVLVQKRINLPADVTIPVLRVDNADLAVAQILEIFAPPIPRPPMGVDAMARVHESAKIGLDVAIGPFTMIGKDTRIGRGTVIHNGVAIGDQVSIGDNCEIFPNVTIRERITIGHRVVIHAGSVLGTDGFGYRWDGSKHQKIPQIGTVIIEDDVEIGSCTCIDRAKFGATRIGRGSKLDNLVQVAHNVRTGPHCIVVGQTGIAGSVSLGAGVVLGGQSAVKDHVELGDGAMVAACSGVLADIPARQAVSGVPAIAHRQHLRELAAIRELPELRVAVKRLEKEMGITQEASGKRDPEH